MVRIQGPSTRYAVRFAVCVPAALMLLAACGSQSRIVGTWSDGDGTVEFVSGNTCFVKQVGFVPVTCTWQELDDGRVVMHETAMGTSVDLVGHFEGALLVFMGPDGKPMRPLRKIG